MPWKAIKITLFWELTVPSIVNIVSQKYGIRLLLTIVVSQLNLVLCQERTILHSMKNKREFLKTIYHDGYWLLSVLFVIAMMVGLIHGESASSIELGIVGLLINPETEIFIRSRWNAYPRWANIAILVIGLIIFGILL